MLKQLKSLSNGKQCDWMRYHEEIEENRKYIAEVWNKNEMEATMEEIRGKVQ